MHTRRLRRGLLAACIALTAACGSTPQDRGISGAGIGAGAGAIIGAVTGLSVLEAAAIGATGGALTGLLTKQNQVDMGEPAWKSGNAGQTAAPVSTATAPAPSADELTRVVHHVQSRLAARGYDPGPVDGVVGERTRAAIRAYQRDQGLPMDGQLTPELIARLNG